MWLNALMGKGRLDITTTKNSLRKLGADLRWLVEKSGVDPETLLVGISVRSQADKDKILKTFDHEFDVSCMMKFESHSDMVSTHGVKIFVSVVKGKEPA